MDSIKYECFSSVLSSLEPALHGPGNRSRTKGTAALRCVGGGREGGGGVLTGGVNWRRGGPPWRTGQVQDSPGCCSEEIVRRSGRFDSGRTCRRGGSSGGTVLSSADVGRWASAWTCVGHNGGKWWGGLRLQWPCAASLGTGDSGERLLQRSSAGEHRRGEARCCS
jgi:hypothetical protein